MSNHSKHLLIMAVCCLAPVVAILAAGTLGLGLGGASTVLPFLLVLLCPLIMALGMGLLTRDDEHHHTTTTQAQPPVAETPKAPER